MSFLITAFCRLCHSCLACLNNWCLPGILLCLFFSPRSYRYFLFVCFLFPCRPLPVLQLAGLCRPWRKVATYHTQARKKLNLHSLRWMLCWSRYFASQSHYIAVLHCLSSVRRAGVGVGAVVGWLRVVLQPHAWATLGEQVLCNYPLSVIVQPPVEHMRSHVNICRGILSRLFRGQDFIPAGISRAILEVKRISLCSPAWSFLTVGAQQQRKLLVLAHTQSRAPSPQKSAHSLYSPNTLLKAIFAAALWEQRYCSCHFQLHRQNGEDILGIYFFSCFFSFFFFFLSLKFHKTWFPSSNFFCLSIC